MRQHETNDISPVMPVDQHRHPGRADSYGVVKLYDLVRCGDEVSHDFAPTVNFSSDDKIDSISLNTIKIIRQKFEPSSWKHALLGIIEKKCEENTTVTEMDCVILPSLISDIKLGLD